MQHKLNIMQIKKSLLSVSVIVASLCSSKWKELKS